MFKATLFALLSTSGVVLSYLGISYFGSEQHALSDRQALSVAGLAAITFVSIFAPIAWGESRAILSDEKIKFVLDGFCSVFLQNVRAIDPDARLNIMVAQGPSWFPNALRKFQFFFVGTVAGHPADLSNGFQLKLTQGVAGLAFRQRSQVQAELVKRVATILEGTKVQSTSENEEFTRVMHLSDDQIKATSALRHIRSVPMKAYRKASKGGGRETTGKVIGVVNLDSSGTDDKIFKDPEVLKKLDEIAVLAGLLLS